LSCSNPTPCSAAHSGVQWAHKNLTHPERSPSAIDAADPIVDHSRNTDHVPEPAQVMQLTRVVDAIDRVSVLIYRDYDCPADQVRGRASVGLDTLLHLQARLCSPIEYGNP